MGKLPDKISNEDGTPTLEFIMFMDNLENGKTGTSLGTLLSGVAAAQAKADGIQAGTVSLEKVVISERGDISGELDSLNSNVGSVAASAGAGGTLSASSDRASVFKAVSGGASGTTSTVTVTASGGTAPYTYLWTKVSGATVTINTPTALSTSFNGTPGTDASLSGTYKCTVTDDVAATTSINVTVQIVDYTTAETLF